MQNVLLATDLDKTLLNDFAEIPTACLTAIRTYIENGGLFTVATGRPTRGVFIYPELIDLINAPLITYNGACIYDVEARRVLWRRLLPDHMKPLLQTALERFPSVGALVFRGDDDYTCVTQPNKYTEEVAWVREHYKAFQCSLDEVPLPWNKIVLSGPPADIAVCADYIRSHTLSPITIILSEGKFLEITGPDVGKGKALRQVTESLHIPQSNVIAIGDSMNDYDMIRWAGTGVAVANAEAEILDSARMIVPSNADHGICECIRQVALPMLSDT